MDVDHNAFELSEYVMLLTDIEPKNTNQAANHEHVQLWMNPNQWTRTLDIT